MACEPECGCTLACSEPKICFAAVARQVLHHVGELATPVVATAGIAFGVFVGEDRPRSLQHGLGHKVFTRDHLQPLVLAESLVIDGGGYFRVALGKGVRHAVIHT